MTTYYKLDHSEPGYLSQMLPRADGTWVKRADYYADFAAAQTEIERLTKERDEARAQVAAAYGSAADALQNVAENWDCGHNESRLCDCARDAEQWGFAADEARSMTPADAKAALESYGIEKVREGMQRASEVAADRCAACGVMEIAGLVKAHILADMEKLK